MLVFVLPKIHHLLKRNFNKKSIFHSIHCKHFIDLRNESNGDERHEFRINQILGVRNETSVKRTHTNTTKAVARSTAIENKLESCAWCVMLCEPVTSSIVRFCSNVCHSIVLIGTFVFVSVLFLSFTFRKAMSQISSIRRMTNKDNRIFVRLIWMKI